MLNTLLAMQVAKYIAHRLNGMELVVKGLKNLFDIIINTINDL